MRRGAAILLCLVLLAGFGIVLASGGTSANPLITLRYMEDIFAPAVLTESGITSENTQTTLYHSAQQYYQSRAQRYLAKLGILDEGILYQPYFFDMRVKQGDVLTIQVGSSVICYAGSAQVNLSSGALIDVTDGSEIANGNMLAPRHRYISGEQTTTTITITSETAVLAPQGFYTLTESDSTNYNQLADALFQLRLFRGSDYAYGGGYELERLPTRVEGLVMFLRLIGEEADALAYTGSVPFTDVAAWSVPYVSYAYEKGYTKGIGEDKFGNPFFGPQQTISADEYMTFLLRALSYRDSGAEADFSWNTALQFARGQAFITDREYDLLTKNEFLRAHVAYLSYFSLDDKVNGIEQTLKDILIAKNVFTAVELQNVKQTVQVKRL